MSLRVLHINAGNLYGGVETVLVTLARERAYCPELESRFALCFRGRLADELGSYRVTPFLIGPIRARYPWQVFQARNRLRRLLSEERFQAVICHMPWSLALFGPVVKKLGLPLLFWMHGPASGNNWVERWASLAQPELVFCNSHFTEASLPSLFSRTPASQVIYCPVSEAPRKISDAERVSIREELKTSKDDCVIIQAGRMEPWKGQMVHLGALSTLRDLPNWVCWFVGGAQRAEESLWLGELKAQAAAFGISERVRFLGERTDVARLLRAADIYCQPNTAPDSFGITLVEAMYAGLPIVTSALGGALEVISPICGRLVKAGSMESLREALIELVNHASLRRQLGNNGPEMAKALSDPKRVLHRLFSVISSLDSCG